MVYFQYGKTNRSFHWLRSALKIPYSIIVYTLSSITIVIIDWAFKDMSQGIRINILFKKFKLLHGNV